MDDHELATWLSIREPWDARARSATLLGSTVGALGPGGPVRVLDLATGTGSNIRHLLERLPGRRQDWLAVDHSATLLALLPARMDAWATERGYTVARTATGCAIQGGQVECHVETRRLDLGRPGAFEPLGRFHLVTASALLDLVSEAWLRALAAWCRDMRAAVLLTLTYNGQTSCTPADPDDALVLRLFNLHQHRDKGLGGPAAGPEAPGVAARCFEDAGFTVSQARSDWVVDPDGDALQRTLIDGWAFAAGEVDPALSSRIAAWRERRLQHVAEGRSRVVVGHDDLAAWLPLP